MRALASHDQRDAPTDRQHAQTERPSAKLRGTNRLPVPHYDILAIRILRIVMLLSTQYGKGVP